MSYDVEVAWQINTYCDFDCVYCWLNNIDKNKRVKGFNNTQKVINSFSNTGLTWLIHMSGGEPFFYPNYLELCQGLTQKHFISINTNLNHKDIYSFSDIINPEKVIFIHASLHIQERERLQRIKEFIKKYKILQKRGFYIFASYLMYPSLIKRFAKDYATFKSEGIILHPKTFWGYYYGIFKIFNSRIFRRVDQFTRIRHFLGKYYPNSYSKEQREFMKYYIEQSNLDGNINDAQKQKLRERTIDLSLDQKWIYKLPSFKGKDCLAGKKFIKMDQYGECYRCNDEQQNYLGNMFEKGIKLFSESVKCTANKCSCPYVGYRYVLEDYI